MWHIHADFLNALALINDLGKGTSMGRGSPTNLWPCQMEGLTSLVHFVRAFSHTCGWTSANLQNIHGTLPHHSIMSRQGVDILLMWRRRWHRTVRLMRAGITANKPWSQGELGQYVHMILIPFGRRRGRSFLCVTVFTAMGHLKCYVK